MSAEAASPVLPMGVGRLSRSWLIFLIVSLGVLGGGIAAYAIQAIEGEVVTGMRNLGTGGGATWGLYITMAIYFIGVSFAGITIAAFIRLTDQEYLKPIARMAEVLTVVSLLLGALAILVDLGQPLRGVTNLFLFARPQSPFFGTFAMVLGGYLFASLVYLYLDGRRDAAVLAKQPSRFQWLHRIWAAGYRDTPAERKRHATTSFWLAIAIIPLLIIAHSTLGFVFGLQVGRPGWFSALQAPAFVILAGISGIGHVIVLAAVVRYRFRQGARLSNNIFAWLGKILMILLLVYVYFLIVDLLTSTYAATAAELEVVNAVIFGEYAWMYWLAIVTLVVPLFLLMGQYFTRRWSLPVLIVSALLVNVAAVVKRYLIVVPSQTYGALLPYGIGSYAPSLVEYAVVAGLLALGAVLFALFVKVFPIMNLRRPSKGGEA